MHIIQLTHPLPTLLTTNTVTMSSHRHKRKGGSGSSSSSAGAAAGVSLPAALSSMASALGPFSFLPPGILPSGFPGASSSSSLSSSSAAAAAAAAATFPLPGLDAAAAAPEEQTCVAESWAAITGPDALLPDEYVRLSIDELQPVFESDLRRLADTSVNPRERCRLAHYLGNFSCTPRGSALYGMAGWYFKTLWGIVQEVKDIYVSGAVVPRPCVAGYAMLALTSCVKQAMRVPPPMNKDASVIDYLLGESQGGNGNSKQQKRKGRNGGSNGGGGGGGGGQRAPGQSRVSCLWTLLKHVTAETQRSRGALKTLVFNLELLTVLELANMGRKANDLRSGGGGSRSSKDDASTHNPMDVSFHSSSSSLCAQFVGEESSLEVVKLHILRAACLVLKHTQSRADVCAAAQALGLFEVVRGETNTLLKPGSEGWRIFVQADGVLPLVAALASLANVTHGGKQHQHQSESDQDNNNDDDSSSSSATNATAAALCEEDVAATASDRLSILSFLTDLGPDHASLILPAIDQLVWWVGAEGPAYEHERTFSLLSLAKFLRGGKDPEDARFAASLGLFPVVVRRLDRYRAAVVAGATNGGTTCECCVATHGGGTRPRLEGEEAQQQEVEGGGQHGELVPAALEVLMCLLLHSEEVRVAACKEALTESGVLLPMLGSLLHEALTGAPEPTRSCVCGLLLGLFTLLVEQDSKVLAWFRTTPSDGRSSSILACLRQTIRFRRLECAPTGVWRLLVHLMTLCLLLDPSPQDHMEVCDHDGDWLFQELEAMRKQEGGMCKEDRYALEEEEKEYAPWLHVLTSRVFGGTGPVSQEDTNCRLDMGIHYLCTAVSMRQRGVDLGPTQAAYKERGMAGLLTNLLMTSTLDALSGLTMDDIMNGGTARVPVCQVCRQTAEAVGKTILLRCARCRSIRYCSKDCQVWHWKKGGHKDVCKEESQPAAAAGGGVKAASTAPAAAASIMAPAAAATAQHQ